MIKPVSGMQDVVSLLDDIVVTKPRQNQAVEACASTSSVNSSEGFFQL